MTQANTLDQALWKWSLIASSSIRRKGLLYDFCTSITPQTVRLVQGTIIAVTALTVIVFLARTGRRRLKDWRGDGLAPSSYLIRFCTDMSRGCGVNLSSSFFCNYRSDDIIVLISIQMRDLSSNGQYLVWELNMITSGLSLKGYSEVYDRGIWSNV